MENKYPENKYPNSELTQRIIGIAIKVHKEIGPGFREKYYQRAMYLEMQRSNLKFVREKEIKIMYGKVIIGYHVLDYIINDTLILELKSIKNITDVDIGQLTVYLRLSKINLGLILNFGQKVLEIKRVKI